MLLTHPCQLFRRTLLAHSNQTTQARCLEFHRLCIIVANPVYSSLCASLWLLSPPSRHHLAWTSECFGRYDDPKHYNDSLVLIIFMLEQDTRHRISVSSLLSHVRVTKVFLGMYTHRSEHAIISNKLPKKFTRDHSYIL